jgi:hypothetical protein
VPRRSQGYKLTVRHRSRVEREQFDDLRTAVAALESHAERIRAEGQLRGVKMLREFSPGDRVAARLEIATGGMIKGTAAGVDVMGDGSMVGFAGGVARRPLASRGGQTIFDAVRRELAG